jgi:hypothetical protein
MNAGSSPESTLGANSHNPFSAYYPYLRIAATPFNTDANETRPWLSWNSTTPYFGSTRTDVGKGMADWYVTTREKLTGHNK